MSWGTLGSGKTLCPGRTLCRVQIPPQYTGVLCALGTASLRFILHGDPSMDADSQMEA